MNNPWVEVYAIVEGKTEQIFIEKVLTPYLAKKNITLHATQVTKPGQKGGDVHFDRVKKDIGNYLKQRKDIYVTTMVDFYGLKEWPGKNSVPNGAKPWIIAETINKATAEEVNKIFVEYNPTRRFIPYMSIYEFEALLFSNPDVLSDELGIDRKKVISILDQFKTPEAINNSPDTAPSKRLDYLTNGNYRKTINNIAVAEKTGVDTMRKKCPVFNDWLDQLESLNKTDNHIETMSMQR